MKCDWDKCGQDGVFISILCGAGRTGIRLGSGQSDESHHLGGSRWNVITALKEQEEFVQIMFKIN